MSSPRKKRDNLSVLKVYLSFIHINTTLKKMAHGIHDIKVILMYTSTDRYNYREKTGTGFKKRS